MNRKFISNSNFILRKILNLKDNTDIIKEFIEVILNIKIENIRINPYLEILKNKLPKEENFGIVNVRVKTKEEEFNVGIQIVDGEHILTKMLLYFSQIHFYQLEYKDNNELARTVTINILDTIWVNETKYHSRMISGKEKNEAVKECIEIHVLELPKFKLKMSKINKKEAWLSYLKGENIAQAIENSEKIKKLDEQLNNYWKEEIIE